MNSSSSIAEIKQVFGNFAEDLPSSQEYLILSFSPSSAPLQRKWRTNGLSADFIADYLSGFLNCEDTNYDESKQLETKSAIGYIANELLENAMKYNNKNSDAPISIQIHLIDNKIILQITNSVCQKGVEVLQERIQEIVDSDPYELYINKLECSAMEDTSTTSGLGFLTMI
ncbi:MAG: DUF6272 family protein, partial [Waterburya sp.]